MQTLLSGQLGRAAIIQGDVATVLGISAEEPLLTLKPSELRSVFAGATDLEQTPLTSIGQVRKLLIEQWKRDRAVALSLLALDEPDDDELRGDAINALDGLLIDAQVRTVVSHILFGQPLTRGASNTASLIIETESEFARLVAELKDHQQAISAVYESWFAIPGSLFGSKEASVELRAKLVRAGIFYEFSRSVAAASRNLFNIAMFKALSELSKIRNYRDIVSAWFNPLVPSEDGSSLRQSMFKEIQSSLEDDADDIDSDQPTSRRQTSAHEAYTQAMSQVEKIKENIRKIRLEVSRRFYRQLVQSQLERGDSDFAAKSLCNLAATAVDCYQFSFAVELAREATRLAPNDKITWSQLADGYIHLRQFDDAIEALEGGEAVGGSFLGASGRARILRYQGRHLESIDAFKKVVSDHYDDPDVWAAYQILGDLQKDTFAFTEAIATYSLATTRFAERSLIWCGYGALLREVGKMDASVQAYRTSLHDNGPSPEAYVGLSETLCDLQDFDGAIRELERGLKAFRTEPSVHWAYSKALRLTGRQREAINVYLEGRDLFPFDASAWHGHAEALAEIGQVAAALRLLDEAIKLFPSEFHLQMLKARLQRERGLLADSLQTLGALNSQFPNSIGIQMSIADVFKQFGRLDDAERRYRQTLTRAPYSTAIKVSLAAIALAKGEIEVAKEYLPAAPPQAKSEWVGHHISGMIALRQGDFGTAIEIFESGLAMAPFPKVRAAFSNALALAKLKSRGASNTSVDVPADTGVASNLIRLHVYGARKQLAEAEMALAALRNKCPPVVVPLRDELAAHLGLVRRVPMTSPEALFRKQCEVLAVIATFEEAA